MGKNRLEAFSDGVLAVIITIMVLDIKAPGAGDSRALLPLVPAFLSYALSFIYVGIYWNNHHHMFHIVKKIDGRVLWANLHLLFWLSLVPFLTSWVNAFHRASVPVAMYGFVLLMAGVAYYILAQALIRLHGKDSAIAKAIGKDTKGKLSALIYAVAIGLTCLSPWLSIGLYATVAAIWFIPDRRVENVLHDQ